MHGVWPVPGCASWEFYLTAPVARWAYMSPLTLAEVLVAIATTIDRARSGLLYRRFSFSRERTRTTEGILEPIQAVPVPTPGDTMGL
jgi:hypothetical protein